MKKYPVIRAIALVIGGTLLIFGAYLFWGSRQIFNRFDSWFEAKPVDIEVNFSRSGTYTAKFEQTCSISHGEIIGLEVPESALSNTDIKTLLNGLDANCIITDSNSNEIVSLELPAKGTEWGGVYFDNLIPLEQMRPFKKGTYKISISVSSGAPALAGIEQHFVARYQLCGLERMPGILLRLVSYTCFVIGGVVMLVTLWISAKRGRKVNEIPSM